MIATAELTNLSEMASVEADAGWAARSCVEPIGDLWGSWGTTAAELEQSVRRRIVQRTWGRLRQLHVEVDPQHVIVRGRSPTYYLKQLALAAVQEALPATPVELDIRVAS